jgi:serine/threonine-protein kinase
LALTPGSRLGPYEIAAPLGAGGMGEVYRARDTRLDRSVAIKVLPEALAVDPDFRERFDREARSLSQLSHPHICTLYDVGEHDGTAFLVMELLDGESLADRLVRADGAALPTADALRIAVDVASALDVAHRAGIVHRDLKPENIFLVRGATASAPPIAKLLDFGLAKKSAPVVATSGLSMAPTTPPASMTAAGTILGTFQYMAPEQIEGMEADARTDIFAFGCVLYEMLSGRKAFEGKTRARLLGSILKDEPAPLTDSHLNRVVATCLAKEPDDRWQTARDLMRELVWIADGTLAAATSAAPQAASSRARGGRAWLAGAGAVASASVAAVVVWALMRQPAGAKPVLRFQIAPAATLFTANPAVDVSLSPDGRRVAYVAGSNELHVREFDTANDVNLASSAGLARGPFFSPDGEWIAYFQNADVKKVSVRGGPAVTLCSDCAAGNRGGAWGPDDTIVFAPAGGTGGLWRVPAAGGDPVVVTTPDSQKSEQSHSWPEFLPDGRAILFAVNAESIEGSTIVARDLKTGKQTTVVRGGSQPRYATSGHLAYGVGGTLRVVGFDLDRLTTVGNPVPVIDHVLMKGGAADFAVSRDGTLVFVSGDVESVGERLAWVGRDGQEEQIAAPPRVYAYVRVSPDGSRVALDIRDQQRDIWIWDFARSVLTRLTTDPGTDQYPAWTPDGRRIVFSSTRGGAPNLYWQASDGTGAAERLTTSPNQQYPEAFTPDGKLLVFRENMPTGGSDINVLSMSGDRVVKPLLNSTFIKINPELSPDGRWLAYESNESGRNEIHVRPFPAVDNGHWQITTDGGTRPLWAPNGRELFYVDEKLRLMRVPVDASGTTFVAGNASVVLASAGVTFGGGPGRFYDISHDGRRFLVLRAGGRSNGQGTPVQLNVVLNWTEELKRLVPTKR